MVEILRQEIITGVLAPGQRLVERELCERLDVSRNTLREACRQLEAEGFLAIPPHKGPVVAVLSERDARGFFEVREALECLAVRLFVERADGGMVAQLLQVTNRLRAAHESGNVRAMLEVKTTFYDVLYAGADNDVLRHQAALLRGRLAGLRARPLAREGRPQTSIDEIDEVVSAIEARDSTRASELWCAHIRSAARSALDEQG
ncbi:GntR family transcriptional regulator [Streptomyces sparsogenes]|uniref:GntR family transcriptional regulator n=1 Tax=Streptomyces sparsogenes TaxID=67365 RepID=UPI00384F32E0